MNIEMNSRSFVPKNLNFSDWPELEKLFQDLQKRKISSKAELESWLSDFSELSACLAEAGSRLYVASSCHTDDPQLEKAYLDFISNIDAAAKPYWFELKKIYLSSPWRQSLDKTRYAVFEREIKAEVEVYRQNNVPLQTKDAKLRQQYQKIRGEMLVNFQGKERTLPEMALFLEDPDPKLRESSWKVTAELWRKRADEFEALYDEMLLLRHEIAQNADFANYRDYKFHERFDYGPKECFTFHDSIEKLAVPLTNQLLEVRRQQMGLMQLRPWDLDVDPQSRPALRPFSNASELCERTQKILKQIDAQFYNWFAEMQSGGELDLETRKGKAAGGYMCSFDETRRPFIFMNAAGTQRDAMTLLHELGHAFHTLECANEPLHYYRHAPIEFSEVASMSMELFSLNFLGAYYSKDELARANFEFFQQLLFFFPWFAHVDAFQHWTYLNPKHSRQERKAFWLSLERRFGKNVDWSGHEDLLALRWHRQQHIFCSPFYYIEYGIAQLGALQLWNNFLRSKEQAIKSYRNGLALGGSKPLPELFNAAGIKFDFSASTMQPLIEVVQKQLAN